VTNDEQEAEPHLILHKVRGKAAFDIAIKMQIGGEDGWLIPTSGHRAYPMAKWQLEDLADISDYPHERPLHVRVTANLDTWPDHYSCNNQHAHPPSPHRTATAHLTPEQILGAL
jgi:hypothetical protein